MLALCAALAPAWGAESDITKLSPFQLYTAIDETRDCERKFEIGLALIKEAAKDDGIPAFADAGFRGVWNACIQARDEKRWNSSWANRVIALPLPGPDVSADNALKYVAFSGLALSEVWGARMTDKKHKLDYDYTEPLNRFEQLAQVVSGLKNRKEGDGIDKSQIAKMREGVDNQIGNLKAVIRAQASILKNRSGSQTGTATSSSGGSRDTAPGKPASDTKTSVTKTFTVTSDARANQTGDESGARGESSITVRGESGTFIVRYWYDWPSAYLISAGKGKTLEGKSVSIQFDGEKATYVSCGAGSGRCQIKSFTRR